MRSLRQVQLPRIASARGPLGRLVGAVSRSLRVSRRTASPATKQDRSFRLSLPTVPEGLSGFSPVAPRELEITAPQSLYVPKCLHHEGLAHYEPETLSSILAAIQTLGVRTVFDVGANVGAYAFVLAALTDCDIIAFEPAPNLAKVARVIARRNGLTYDVVESAVGAEAGTAQLYLSSVTDSSNSLLRTHRPYHRSITVAVETLDGYCSRAGVVPDLIKVDTEATEPDVLKGAVTVITRHRPWIVCEVLAGRTEASLMKFLEPFHYHWYQIGAQFPPVPRFEIVGDPDYKYMNWLFAPEAPPEAFWQAMESWQKALACMPPPRAAHHDV